LPDGDTAFTVRLRQQPGPLPAGLAKLGRSDVLHERRQFWVHVDEEDYRELYHRIFPPAGQMYLDHVFNRKLAREYGYRYLRLVPVASAVNTSGGRGLETFAVKESLKQAPAGARPLERQPSQPVLPRSRIAYAGPFAICKMLNRKPGNWDSLPGVQEVYAAMCGS